MFKLDLEKAEEPEIKLRTSTGSLRKQESSRKTYISALLTMPKPWLCSVHCSSVTQLCLTLCDQRDCSMPGFPVHHQLAEHAQNHVHQVGELPTISTSSVVPFSSCLQSFPASGSFPMTQFFTSGGQSIGVSSSASIFPMNIQDWFPLGLTSLISLKSKGLSKVFSITTVQKHQLLSTKLSSWSYPQIHTRLLEKP